MIEVDAATAGLVAHAIEPVAGAIVTHRQANGVGGKTIRADRSANGTDWETIGPVDPTTGAGAKTGRADDTTNRFDRETSGAGRPASGADRETSGPGT